MIDRADISGLHDDDPPDDPRQSYVDDYLDFDGLFEAEPVHHRWLLTTCVAGITGSLVVGSALLGIFGQNAVPRDAYAGIQKSEITGTVWQVKSKPGDSVESGDTLVVIESMKMEIPVITEDGGVVKEILVKEKDPVAEGQVVAVLEG